MKILHKRGDNSDTTNCCFFYYLYPSQKTYSMSVPVTLENLLCLPCCCWRYPGTFHCHSLSLVPPFIKPERLGGLWSIKVHCMQLKKRMEQQLSTEHCLKCFYDNFELKLLEVQNQTSHSSPRQSSMVYKNSELRPLQVMSPLFNNPDHCHTFFLWYGIATLHHAAL